jgi:hypothetical protein
MKSPLRLFQTGRKNNPKKGKRSGTMPKKQTEKSKKRSSSTTKTKHKIKDIGKIQEKAYFLWADKGFPENTELDNWLEAEKQLCY